MYLETSSEAMVRPTGSNLPAARARPPRPGDRQRTALTDTVELSPRAQAISRQRTAGLRTELIDRVRQEIAEGTYLTPERLDAAAERLARVLRPA